MRNTWWYSLLNFRLHRKTRFMFIHSLSYFIPTDAPKISIHNSYWSVRAILINFLFAAESSLWIVTRILMAQQKYQLEFIDEGIIDDDVSFK